MITSNDLSALARDFHAALPARIRAYLNGRGIPDTVIDHHQLGWNGTRITIPITNREGIIVFFRLARDPDEQAGPKMIAPPGSRIELYGWERVLIKPDRIIICEGEFDRLVLESQGFGAVTSTGGAKSFRPSWVADFEPISDVLLCFDRDTAGQEGARTVARLLPMARVVELPEEVGEGGDVTDFFVTLGRTREDFERLLEAAQPLPIELPVGGSAVEATPLGRDRIEQVKQAVPIDELIGRYLPLELRGRVLMGRCPFHDDHTSSLAVYPRQGKFYCFGCGKYGDAITFTREIEHLSFTEALDWLEDKWRNYAGNTTKEE